MTELDANRAVARLALSDKDLLDLTMEQFLSESDGSDCEGWLEERRYVLGLIIDAFFESIQEQGAREQAYRSFQSEPSAGSVN